MEGVLIAGAGAVFGLVLAAGSEQLINRFFQWRYDTALVFVHITPAVALRCVAIAVPLGVVATVVASWALLRRNVLAAGAPMRALAFAWRSLVRQPARTALGILGVAAVGALLFDMLLLSDGLVVSMRDLLDRIGFDVRVTATDDAAGRRPPHAERRRRPRGVRGAAGGGARDGHPLRRRRVERPRRSGRPQRRTLRPAFDTASWQASIGDAAVSVDGAARAATARRGRATADVVNEALAARTWASRSAASLPLRAAVPSRSRSAAAGDRCASSGIVEFPFDAGRAHRRHVDGQRSTRACGGNTPDEADADPGVARRATRTPAAAAIAARTARPACRDQRRRWWAACSARASPTSDRSRPC